MSILDALSGGKKKGTAVKAKAPVQPAAALRTDFKAPRGGRTPFDRPVSPGVVTNNGTLPRAKLNNGVLRTTPKAKAYMDSHASGLVKRPRVV